MKSSRTGFVRAVSAAMCALMLGPGPLQAMAQAAASQRAAHAAMAGMARELDSPPSPPPVPAPAAAAPRLAAAQQGASILPVPLRPAAVEWIDSASHDRDPWALFDGRASTGFEASTSEPARLAVALEAPTQLSAVTVLGPASGTLSVFAQEGPALRPIESLTNLEIHTRAGEWKHFSTHDGLRVDHLVLQWMPSAPVGPTEIGLWGLGLPRPDASDAELADRILSDAAPGATSVLATPGEGRLARIALGTNGPSEPDRPVAFHATLRSNPRALSRAFLVYELTGLGHWTAPVRQINGLAVRGGFRSPSADAGIASEGGLQVEEIAPEWLRPGDNEIRFFPLPEAGAPAYSVRAVRVVGVPHASVIEARLGDAAAWPFEQRLAFGASSQPHDVVFDLLRPSAGQLLVRPVGAKNRKPVRIDLGGLETGWHHADLDELPVTEGLAIALDGPGKKAARIRTEDATPVVSGVALTASAVPNDADDERIVVTYPLHGECIDHATHVRGFVEVPRNTDEASGLRVNGEDHDAALGRDASFELTVPEPDRASGKSWDVTLEAPLASGRVLRHAVKVQPCLDPAAPDGKLAEDEGAPFADVVHAGEAKTIAFGGARLDIPAGAIDKDVRITVRPLVSGQVPRMDQRMGNVSPEGRAFRFGPHGLKFNKPVKLTLPYDAGAFKSAMHERDVRTFYFDEKQARWMPIGRYGVAEGGALTSLSEHFTDFVNATLAMPDEPGPQSFDPNEMKGIKIADPSASVDLIAPPVVNSAGAASLGYPIEVPPGRNGVEPQLAFSYNSHRTNGWLGVGWDLSISSIEIDTRFGVPKYDLSEKYVLDGQQLVATSPGSNTYVRRVEGRFDTIQRVLDASGLCVAAWTVTDKHGTVFTYGNAGAQLVDPTDANKCRIFRWGLSSVQDTFGNAMTVSYRFDTGAVPGSTDQYTQFYPQDINYTSHAADLGPAYNVHFALDDGATRNDVLINGRPGFQERTRFRLDHVDVSLQLTAAAGVIRRYQLAYLADAPEHFHKTLLGSVGLLGLKAAAQIDAHTFEYAAAPTSTFSGGATGINGFTGPQAWGQVQVAANTPRGDDALSGIDDTMGGGGGSLGIGLPFISATVGAGGNTGGETTNIQLLDINGDGLPDSIDNGGHASLNFLNPGLSVVPPAVPVPLNLQFAGVTGLGDLAHTHKGGWSVNGQIGFTGGQLSGSYSNTSVDDDKIMSDIDGDGFPDLVSVNNSQLTWLRNDGLNHFAAPQKAPTNSAQILPNGRSAQPDLDSKAAVNFYRAAPIVRWIAPFDGPIQILGTLQKLVAGGNGVDAFVFDNNVTLWSRTIAASDITTACVPSGSTGCDPSGLTATVHAGDSISLLIAPHHDPAGPTTQLGLESIDNQVQWAPTILYTNAPAGSGSLREAYGAHVYSFSQADDMRLVGQPQVFWTASAQGAVHITADINKSTTSDDVTISIVQKGSDGTTKATLLPPRTFHGQDVGQIPIPIDANVSFGDQIGFTMTSDTPIDPTRVGWTPQVTYTNYCRVDSISGQLMCGTVSCSTDPQGDTVCLLGGDPEQESTLPADSVSQPGQVFYALPEVLQQGPTQAFVSPSAQTVTVGGSVEISAGTDAIVLLQGVDEVYAKVSVGASLHGGPEIAAIPSTSVTLQPGDELFVTVFSNSPVGILSNSVAANGTAVPGNVWTVDPAFGTDPTTHLPDFPMSGGFHRWFSGFYNIDNGFSLNNIVFPFRSDGTPVSTPPKFVFGMPEASGIGSGPAWAGPGGSYIAAGGMNTTRAGATAGGGGGSLNSLRHATTWDLDFGASFGGVGLSIGGGYNNGRTNTDHEFLDFNGDRYPDAISLDGNVQFGDGTGGFLAAMPIPGIGQLAALRRVHHSGFHASLGTDMQEINDVATDGSVRKKLSTGFHVGVDYGLSTTHIDWIDINGDGLPDAVTRNPNDVSGTSNPFMVQLNYGYRLGDPMPWNANVWDTSSVGPRGDIIHDVGDVVSIGGLLTPFVSDVGVNGIRTQDSGSNTADVGVNLSTGGESIGGGAGYTFNVTRTLVDLVDVNGDGLPDEVMKVPGEDGTLRVRLNLGGRFEDHETLWSLPEWNQSIDSGADALSYAFLGNIDDSLDFRRSKTFTSSFEVQVCFFLCVGVHGYYATGSSWAHTNIEDINGDGLPDMVFKPRGNGSAANATVYAKLNNLNANGPVNLLTKVHRPFGGEFAMTYSRSGNLVRRDLSPPVDEPTNKFVVTQVDVDDGRNNHYVRGFSYDPSGFHDRVEREDYGFAKCTTTREDSSTVETDYENQDFYRKGLMSSTFTRDASGNLFEGQEIAYAGPSSNVLPVTGTFFPKENTRFTDFYEGVTTNVASPGERLEQDRSWNDTNGNLVSMTDRGETSTGAGAGAVTYAIAYDSTLSQLTPPIFRPSDVTACAGTTCTPGSSSALRDRTATYESHGALRTLTNVVRGGTDPVSGAAYTGSASTNPTWTFAYDEFGNVQSEVAPIGPNDPSGYTLTYGYDQVAETYRIEVADSFGYTSFSVPDFNFGAVAAETDVNGNMTLFGRDAFGRLMTVDGPNDIGAPEHTIAFCYSELGGAAPPTGCTGTANTLPAFATTAHKDILHAGDPIVTSTFVDGLDRVIQSKKDITKDPGSGPGSPVMSVSGALSFDPRGRVQQKGQPVFDTNAATTFVATPMVNPTTFGYDVIDRATSVQTPDGALTTTSYLFDTIDGAMRLATRVRDANVNAAGSLPGTVRESFRDVRDNVIAVQESNRLNGVSPTTLITRYAYDPLDELLQVSDAKGNATTATYDTVGRMVALGSADTGLTQYSYDLPGHLGAKQTPTLRAKNKAIHYQYAFNRLQQVNYPFSPAVVYAYGDSTEVGETGFNRASRVKQETSEAGTKSYEYDALGNVVQQSWSLNKIDDTDDKFAATMAYTYDSFGRLLTMSFPGRVFQETVSYGYDAGGNVTTAVGADQKGNVTNYLLGIGYDQFEQRTRMVSGNGVQTTYAYDPLTRRLTNVNASELDPLLVQLHKPARPFQEMVYSYDLVGNITQIKNNAPFDPQELGPVQVGPQTQHFAYDDLYQLKTADGLQQPSQDDTFTYGLGFTYDAIGNVVQKAQTSASQELSAQTGKVLLNQPNLQQTYTSNYTYAGPRPHAPTEVDDTVPLQSKPLKRSLSYDANGNQTGWIKQVIDKRVVTFDEEDRVTLVAENGLEQSEVTYDGAGQRAVKQAHGVDETAFFGPNLTLRDGLFSTKNIFAGTTRIASRLDPDNDGDGPVLYFHDDHLGSTNFLTDSQQNLQAHEEYFPSGELWIDQTSDPQHTQVPYLFTGKELDTETNLYYFGARYYDPRLSVWVSPDPMLASYMQGRGKVGGAYRASSLDLYTYSRNNPVVLGDPDGMESGDVSLVGAPGHEDFKPSFMGPLPTPKQLLERTGVILLGVATVTGIAAGGEIAAGVGAAATTIARGATKVGTAVAGALGTLVAKLTASPQAQDELNQTVQELEVGASNVNLTSGQAGEVIGWGTGQSAGAVDQTRAVTQNLTESVVKGFAEKGVTREWVAGQLSQYQSALAAGAKKLQNVQLQPRAELMQKILAPGPKEPPK